MRTYTVAPSYSKRGWRIKARSPWDAIILIPQIRFSVDAQRVRQHSWETRYYSRTGKSWVDVWKHPITAVQAKLQDFGLYDT